MSVPQYKPLLTRDDLPLEHIAQICDRWNLRELAIDTTQKRPPERSVDSLDADPFTAIDLYLIADFGPGEYDWGFKKPHFDVVEELQKLLGARVWIEDKGILEKHVAKGAGWARREKESRDVIYTARGTGS